MSNKNSIALSLPPITQSGFMATKLNFPNCINLALIQENGIIRLKNVSPNVDLNYSINYSRMSFVDPSNHLTKVVEDVKKIIDTRKTNKLLKITGMTFKDAELVELMKVRFSGLETEIIAQEGDSRSVPEISNLFDSTTNWTLSGTSILVVRHIVEHLEDPLNFVNQIIDALPMDGYIVIEVPSSSLMYSGSLFPDFWDEHKSYFDLQSIGNLFQRRDFEILLRKEYKTEAENVLILIGQRTNLHRQALEEISTSNLIAKLNWDFERIKNIVENYEEKNQHFTFVGATHAVVNFIDLFVTHGDRCTIIDNSESRIGNFVTKYSIKIVKSGIEKYLDKECIWLTSISSDRLKLYYESLSKNRNLVNLDKL